MCKFGDKKLPKNYPLDAEVSDVVKGIETLKLTKR